MTDDDFIKVSDAVPAGQLAVALELAWDPTAHGVALRREICTLQAVKCKTKTSASKLMLARYLSGRPGSAMDLHEALGLVVTHIDLDGRGCPGSRGS
jgi:hypothetical protein